MKNKETIVVGYATSGSVHADFADTLVNLMKNFYPKRITGVLKSTGSYIDHNRNICVEEFLKTGADWLLFLDTDISLDINGFERLIERADADKYPIISGKYFINMSLGYEKNIQLCAKEFKGNFVYGKNDINAGQFMSNYPDDEVITGLHGCAMGYSLIHRDVFLKIRQENYGNGFCWFKTEYRNSDREFVGEDDYFFEQIRKAGYKISLYTGAEAIHVSRMNITEADFKPVIR